MEEKTLESQLVELASNIQTSHLRDTMHTTSTYPLKALHRQKITQEAIKK